MPTMRGEASDFVAFEVSLVRGAPHVGCPSGSRNRLSTEVLYQTDPPVATTASAATPPISRVAGRSPPLDRGPARLERPLSSAPRGHIRYAINRKRECPGRVVEGKTREQPAVLREMIHVRVHVYRREPIVVDHPLEADRCRAPACRRSTGP